MGVCPGGGGGEGGEAEKPAIVLRKVAACSVVNTKGPSKCRLVTNCAKVLGWLMKMVSELSEVTQ